MPSTSVRVRYVSCSLLNLTSSLASMMSCRPPKKRPSPSSTSTDNTLCAEYFDAPSRSRPRSGRFRVMGPVAGDKGLCQRHRRHGECSDQCHPSFVSFYQTFSGVICTNHVDLDGQHAFVSKIHIWHAGGSAMLLGLQNLHHGQVRGP